MEDVTTTHVERISAPDAAACADVGNVVSAYYTEHFGRAPDAVEAGYWAGDRFVVVSHGVLTYKEQSYITRIDQLAVRECRTLFQYADPARLTVPVGDILDRRVIALVSGIDVPNDIATETFILEPGMPRLGRIQSERRSRNGSRRSGRPDRRAADPHVGPWATP